MERELIKRYIFPDRDAWKNHRKTLFTSSVIHRLTANGKRKMTEQEKTAHKIENPKSRITTIEDETILSDGAVSYILELLQNELSEPDPEFYNRSMEWGNTTEPQAALALAEKLGMDHNSSDFIYTSENGVVFFEYNGICGGTPDILLPSLKADAEIKCCDGDTHLRHILFLTPETFEEDEPEHYDQMQHNMMLTGSEKTLYVSYDPRFKHEHLRMHIIEIKANSIRQAFLLRKILIADRKKKEFKQILKVV